MEPWIGVIGIVVGIILAEAVHWFRDWRERDEKYRFMIYEKRLEAHQMAFYWIRELNKSFPGSIEDMDEGRVAAIQKVIDEVDRWWGSNRFYLDEESQSTTLGVIVQADYLIRDYGLPKDTSYEWDEDKRKSWVDQRWELTRHISATAEVLAKGIGMRHIEEIKKEQPKGKS